MVKLHTRHPPRARRSAAKTSYTRMEFKRVADAARADLRAAAARIRGNRQLFDRYRAGEVDDPNRRLELLDFVDRHGDVPRRIGRAGSGTRETRMEWVLKFGTVAEVVAWAHLSAIEATAGAILLAVMTGENKNVILDAPAAHHRADGHTGRAATAILDTRKPRRGRRAHMNLVLEQIPNWISIPAEPAPMSAHDELHTPFGVYTLLLELTSRSREITGCDGLLIGHHTTGRDGRGFRVVDGSFCFRPGRNATT
ncbi:hypothetical protein AB4305_16810 [Nocardia sp. 2YAB30]|uniref:hypothetical protein n=1 Tax=unclassified Nocardia TaxID=2637762 RepID=UPI003F9E0A19